MGEMKLLVWAYGLFISAIVIERLWMWRSGRVQPSLAESVSSVASGAGYQWMELTTKAMFLAPYLWVSEHAPVRLPNAWWTWLLAAVAHDFCYYWYHRHQHEVNVLWAIHVTHHSSAEYNLATALRQSLFTGFTKWIYLLPLAALGVPPLVFFGVAFVDLVFQFCLHTEWVRKLGPLEWVLNTPSHHRVHHGSHEPYLDRNFGGLLIVWDRMFGTFVEENERPRYGITHPLHGKGVIITSTHYLAELIGAARATGAGWREVLSLCFRSPLAGLAGRRLKNPPLEREAPAVLGGWAALHVLVATGALSALILVPEPSRWLWWATWGWLAWALLAVTALVEQRTSRTALLWEPFRMFATVVLGLAWWMWAFPWASQPRPLIAIGAAALFGLEWAVWWVRGVAVRTQTSFGSMRASVRARGR